MFSICRAVVAGKACITVLPQEAASAAGLHEILVARSFQSAFRKAMDLAGWGGPVRLDSEEPARPLNPSPVGEGPGERAWDQSRVGARG